MTIVHRRHRSSRRSLAILLLIAGCGSAGALPGGSSRAQPAAALAPDTGWVELARGTWVSKHDNLQSFPLPATALFRIVPRPSLEVPAGSPVTLEQLRTVRARQLPVQGPGAVYWVGREEAPGAHRAPRAGTGIDPLAIAQRIRDAIAAEREAICRDHDTLRRAALRLVARDLGILKALDAARLDPAAYPAIARAAELRGGIDPGPLTCGP